LGEKLNDADLIGCPYRLIVSQKNIDLDQVEFKERSKDNSEMIKRSDLLKFLKEYAI